MSKKIILIFLTILISLGLGYLISNQSQKDKPGNDVSVSRSNVKTLDLSGQQLTTLPDSVLNQTDVTVLNLSNNQLTSLPAGIARLINLEILNIENNRLEGKLPEEIGDLKNLKEIRSNNNRMSGIPAAIGQLSKLEVADFSNNRLVGLPLELGNLSQLKLLDLSGYNSSASDLQEIKAKLTNTQIKT